MTIIMDDENEINEESAAPPAEGNELGQVDEQVSQQVDDQAAQSKEAALPDVMAEVDGKEEEQDEEGQAEEEEGEEEEEEEEESEDMDSEEEDMDAEAAEDSDEEMTIVIQPIEVSARAQRMAASRKPVVATVAEGDELDDLMRNRMGGYAPKTKHSSSSSDVSRSSHGSRSSRKAPKAQRPWRKASGHTALAPVDDDSDEEKGGGASTDDDEEAEDSAMTRLASSLSGWTEEAAAAITDAAAAVVPEKTARKLRKNGGRLAIAMCATCVCCFTVIIPALTVISVRLYRHHREPGEL